MQNETQSGKVGVAEVFAAEIRRHSIAVANGHGDADALAEFEAAVVTVDESIEKIGQVADTLDNIAHALQMPMPAHLHVEALRGAIPQLHEELRAALSAIRSEK